jgi:hypothetical protein
MLPPQLQPNRWSCVVTSFAMALGIKVDDLIKSVGHDGSEIVSPDQGPAGRRGFHVQECIEIAWLMGFAATEIELFPVSQLVNGHTKMILFPPDAANLDGNWDRFRSHVLSSRGVILGRGPNHGHAVAYENGLVSDPGGTQYHFTQGACEQRHFYCTSLWRLDRIKQ